MSWLRFDALTFQDRAVRRSGRAGRLVFMAALTMTKAHLWEGPDGDRGYLPEKDFNPDEIAVWFGEGGPDAVAFYAGGLSACISEGLIERGPGGFRVPNWKKFQPDQSNAARQQRFRNNTRDEGRNRYSRYKRGQPRKSTPTDPGVTGRNVSNDDVTGRDGATATSTSPSSERSSPQPTGGGPSSPALRPPPTPASAGGSNGHGPAAPETAARAIADIRERLTGHPVPRPMSDAARAAHADRVRAQVAAFQNGEIPCAETSTAATTKQPTTEPPPSGGSAT